MDRYVLITGATSGIGRATAYAFAEAGYNLALCARRYEKLEEVRDGLSGMNVDVDIFALDVRDRDAVNREIGALLERVKHIDVLVNNAGLARGLSPFQENEITDIEEMFDTNVKGLTYVTLAVLPSMLAQNRGHIINIGSTAGMVAYSNGSIYCATKAAVRTFTDGLRLDVTASDIKVTTIQPGIVQTPFSEVRFHGDAERASKVYEGIDALQAEDIANAIVFAASQPKHVQIAEMTIMATQQGNGFTMVRK